MPTTIDPPSIGAELEAAAQRLRERVERALQAASEALAENILEQGREDISGAGNFGQRWTAGFTYGIDGDGTVRTIILRHAVPYWRVFQYGALIQGKPLLWIPLSFAGIPPGMYARDFPGRLFRVNRKSGGAPLLLSADDKKPKYHGQESVRIPKKFHLVEIARAQSATIGALFRLEMANG